MEVDDQYFTSYEDLDVHKLMLDDQPRNKAYRDAILGNSELFRDKVVMDIGAGTGILSVFCAEAGAKKVYAVEASNIALVAREVVMDNKLGGVIEVCHSRLEDLKLNIKVDIIVSEWMGFYLLHEGMLDTILEARDRFLKPDGKMFPESAAIFVAPCSVPSLYQKWENVDGVIMTSFGKYLRRSKGSKPEILDVKPEDLIAEKQSLCWIDLKEDTKTDLQKYSTKHVVAANKTGLYQGICVWFECYFPSLTDDRVILSTDPAEPSTHWKQTVIVLQNQHEVEMNEPIGYELEISRDQNNPRRYNMQVTLLDPEVEEHNVPCDCYMTKCIITKAFINQHPEKSKDIENATVSNEINEELCLVDEPIDD